MKTITFYSYKGGVGRSLALSNIAIRLSEFNKKVCVIDFDLDAPGLQFKFKNNTLKINKGIVDYIHEFSCNGNIPKSIEEYVVEIPRKNQISQPIQFIPAGNIDNNEYWHKLTAIKWSELLYTKDSMGIDFFLDMKAKIEKELDPDFLLIDSRTGITDMSGITLRLLADEVVVLATTNEENIYGSKKIMKSLLDPSLSLFGEIPRINFILTRLPFTDIPMDREKENRIVEKIRNDLKEYLGLNEFNISMIHSDKRLEEDEKQMIGDDYEQKTVSISNDYLQLFDILTLDVLTYKERELFKNIKNAEKEFKRALNENDNLKKLQLLNKAIELDQTQFLYFSSRGATYNSMKDYKNAIMDFTKALELNPDNIVTYCDLGEIFVKEGNKTKAVSFLEQAIAIDPDNMLPYLQLASIYDDDKNYIMAIDILTQIIEIDQYSYGALNDRANLFRKIGEYNKAKIDIYKAIEANVEYPVVIATLAEIYACENKIEEFYLNLSIALSKGLTAHDLNRAKEVYKKFKNEERFINLMTKYNIDIEEIFKVNID